MKATLRAEQATINGVKAVKYIINWNDVDFEKEIKSAGFNGTDLTKTYEWVSSEPSDVSTMQLRFKKWISENKLEVSK